MKHSGLKEKTEISDSTHLSLIHHVASHIYEQSTLEEMAWLIASSIEKYLGYDDCVIYQMDTRRNVLSQIAAIGSKVTENRNIINPLEIKVGDGVVGSIAETGQSRVIHDISLIEDYIVDDQVRNSEITVPILINDKVIGIIDLEHPDTYAFSQRDLQTLETISSIISSQFELMRKDQTYRDFAQKLAFSENRWYDLVDNQPQGIQITVDKQIRYLNPAGLQIYGVESLDQLKGKNVLDFADPEMHETFSERIERLRAGETVAPIEFAITALDGAHKVIEVNSLLTTYKEETAIQTTLRDVTKQYENEKELKTLSHRLSTLIKNMNSGILLEDSQRCILLINQKFCDLFQIPADPDQMVGADCSESAEQVKDLFKDSERFIASTERCLSEQKTVIGEVFEMKDGRFLERDFIALHLDDNYIGHMWQYEDITSRKRAEIDTRNALELEKKYNELNKHFISMASHEFRTPLTSISSTTEILLDYSERFDKEQIICRLDRIHRASKNMESLLEDILTLGKLDALQQSLTINTDYIPDYVRQFISDLSSDQLENRELRLRISPELENIRFHTDTGILGIILKNVILNAHKYSPQGTEIEASFEKAGDQLKILIKDQGYGIPKDQLETIFETFKRGSNVSDIKGTGLGLAIVERSINNLGGQIRIGSELNKGTEVHIAIPIEVPQ